MTPIKYFIYDGEEHWGLWDTYEQAVEWGNKMDSEEPYFLAPKWRVEEMAMVSVNESLA